MIEQFSAWHNVPIGTKANGLDGFDTVLEFNTPLEAKLLQNLVDLQKDKSFDYSGRTNTGEGRFTSGECAMFMTSSGFYPNVKANAKFDFTAAPMPYFPDVKGAPQNSIIGGASLWVMGGKSAEEYKGIAKFFTFLSDTDRQANLHEVPAICRSPRRPTRRPRPRASTRRTRSSKSPLKELTNKPPTENSRGLRFGNMVQMRDVWAEEIEAALGGKKTPRKRWMPRWRAATQMLRQFETHRRK